MGRITLIGGPWDGNEVSIPKSGAPADPYRVETRESQQVHIYELVRAESGRFEYHYSGAEKLK